jgi:dTDP-4-dehydrorhamnose 3,5-epimerase-like enzyme
LYKCDDIYAPQFDSGIHRASDQINRQTASLQDIINEYELQDGLIISEKDIVLGAFDKEKVYF